MKKALALIRISTDGQDVARQRADIRKLEKQYGLHIIRTLELVGVSGTATLTNEQIQQLLHEVRQPGVDGLACSAVDRLARPKRGSDFGIATAFEDAHKDIWTVRDGHIALWSDEGWERFMTALTRAGSEWREIRRRCMDGKAAARAEGRHVNGEQTLPDGLKFDKRTGVWSYDETYTSKIAEAYRILFADHNVTLTALAKRVGWSCGFSLRRTLQNPTWRGIRAYPASADQEAFEVRLPLEPLLTPEKWQLAQMLLAKRRTWSKETREQRHLGAGLLICTCGQRYYTHGDVRRGQHDTYYCASRFPRGKGCGAALLWRETVDAAIVEIVEEYMTDAKFLTAIFRRIEQKPRPDNTAKREAESSRLKAKRARLVDALEDGLIDKAEFTIRAEKIQTAMREIEATMPAALQPPVLDYRAVVAGLVRALARFRTWPFAEQRTTLKRVVRSFQVVDDAIPDVTLQGGFLGEIAYTKPAQPLTRQCSRRCRAS
jgi:DNA invertase Pin-like site-specific DNA recombinase